MFDDFFTVQLLRPSKNFSSNETAVKFKPWRGALNIIILSVVSDTF